MGGGGSEGQGEVGEARGRGEVGRAPRSHGARGDRGGGRCRDDEDLELAAKEASTPGGDGGVLLIMPPPFLLAVLLFRLGDVCKYPLMDFIPLRLGPASR